MSMCLYYNFLANPFFILQISLVKSLKFRYDKSRTTSLVSSSWISTCLYIPWKKKVLWFFYKCLYRHLVYLDMRYLQCKVAKNEYRYWSAKWFQDRSILYLIKPKNDNWLSVDLAEFLCFYLSLPGVNLKLFCFI